MRNLDRACKKLDALRVKWGKRAYVPTLVLCRTLNKEFKTLHVKFRFTTIKPFDKNIRSNSNYYIEGYYDNRVPGVYTEEPLYEIVVVRRKKLPRFMVNKWFWEELHLILAHEFKHAQQYAARKGRAVFREKRKNLHDRVDHYLCSYDEIDAHAYESALEWKLKGGDIMKLPQVKKYYRRCRRLAMPEWRRFISRVYKYKHQL